MSADPYASASDELLVLLARDKNQRAFAVLVERHQGWLRNLLRRLAHDRALADDLAQQVLWQAWEALPNLRAGQALPAWLKSIAVHTWLKQLRRKDPLFSLARDAPVPEQTVDSAPGMVLDLDRALTQLPEAVRLCVVLSYHEGLSHGEIARLTGLPVGTVKSHISRGSAQLRVCLAAYETRRPSA
jgi:RNA polymerase sigma-70 factor, ECF subfamily